MQSFNAVEDARSRASVPLTYFEFGTLGGAVAVLRARASTCSCSKSGWAGASTRSTSSTPMSPSHERRHRPRRLPRRHARGHRAREGGHLPPGTAGGVRGPAAARAVERRRARHRRASPPHRPRLRFQADERTQWRYRGPARRTLRTADPGVARRVPARQRSRPRWRRSTCLHDRLPVSAQAIREGLLAVELPGRFQVLPGRPATCSTSRTTRTPRVRSPTHWARWAIIPETIAVCAMLADKDVRGVVACVATARRSLVRRRIARRARRRTRQRCAMRCSRRASTPPPCAHSTTSRRIPRSARGRGRG